jgi:phage protein D
MKTNNMASTVTVRNTQTGQGGAKKPLVGTATTSDVPAKLGRTSGLEWAQRVWTRNDVRLDDQRLSKPGEAKQVAQADMERRALEYITGNGSCIGNPGLLSRTIIKLSNLGPRCSGNYYVTSTTHTVDAGGYRTEFTAKRDGR